MPKRTVHVLNAVLLLLLVAGGVLAYGELPSTIPTHFSFTGQPDGYSDRANWFVLLSAGLATAAIVYGCAYFVGRRPGALNMPNQAQFDALPDTAKHDLALFWTHILYWMATNVLVLFAAIQVGTYAVATGRADALPPYVLAVEGVIILGSLLSAPLLIWITQHRMDRLSDQADAERG